jgi:hypothetical protein
MHRWQDNIKIDLGGMCCVQMNWINLTEDGVQMLGFVNTEVSTCFAEAGNFLDRLYNENPIPRPFNL